MVILYIHGMGGGSDSRIPRLLREWFSERVAEYGPVDVVCRTYDFDPEIALKQVCEWVSELSPDLIVGESLGCCNALRANASSLPHIFISPALNAPVHIGWLAALALVPGVTPLLDRIYRPRRADRQALHFTYRTMRKYRKAWREMTSDPASLAELDIHAFFGEHDHYRRRGIVSLRTWERFFGAGTYTMYNGTHFMEEEFIYSLLIPKILLTLRPH